ncbi:unnamed protein product [Psylliodes chrysocephalus]|uniref:Uncharacterized protein n=1 Tax=Psylliodes chrysocephalus TaxID=3402493 RepID=A0A9P0DEJ1_9CUCU|nr:unnamed protein product [Psylliodes chrysocephala]
MIRSISSRLDENGFLKEENRGKHDNHPQLDEDLVQAIKNHINSIPRMESHYVRANTERDSWYVTRNKMWKIDKYLTLRKKKEKNQVVSSPTPGNTSLFLDLVANIDGWFKIRMNLLWKWHLSLVKLQLVRNIEGSRLKLGLDHGNLVNISCDFD